MGEESESSFAFSYDGNGLSITIGNLIPEQAIALLAGVRELLADTGAGEARERVAAALERGDADVSGQRPRADIGRGDNDGVEKTNRRGRKPRAPRAVVNEPVQSTSGSAEGPGDTRPGGSGNAVDKPELDPWGLVPNGEDADSYNGADSDVARGETSPEGGDNTGAVSDNSEAPVAEWSRSVIAEKGRLREMVEYLHSCGVDTPFKIASVLNISSMRDDIAVIGRIPENQMEDRVKIIMESLGILK